VVTALRALFALAEPDVSGAWWFIFSPLITAVVGVVGTVVVMRYREGPTGRRRSGELIPKSTVDILLSAKDTEIVRRDAAKDAELAAKDREIERWMTAFNVSDAARQQMAQSFGDLTDAVELLADGRAVKTRAHEETPNGRQQRR
jgi:hypothetical protein